MILVPGKTQSVSTAELLNNWRYITITTKEEHDAMIAYTYPLHGAYVKVRNRKNKKFSAGVWIWRVALCNPDMWTGAFLENADNWLTKSILIDNLVKINKAIKERCRHDRSFLRRADIKKRKFIWNGYCYSKCIKIIRCCYISIYFGFSDILKTNLDKNQLKLQTKLWIVCIRPLLLNLEKSATRW